MLPAWLREASYPVLAPPRGGQTSFRDKMRRRIEVVFTDDSVRQNARGQAGLWQGLEPRVKMVGTAALLIAVAFAHSLVMLTAVHMLLIAAVLFSRLPLAWFCRRVWLITLAFTGLVAVPAIFAAITPGDIIWQMGGVGVSRQGVVSAALLVMRAAASLGLVQLLLATTSWPVITRALGNFGLPAPLITVLDLCYRFLFIFLALLACFCEGRQSRLVGREDQRQAYQWIGSAVAGMARLCLAYAGEIGEAMYARGYSGNARMVLSQHVGGGDILWLAGMLIMAVAVMGV